MLFPLLFVLHLNLNLKEKENAFFLSSALGAA